MVGVCQIIRDFKTPLLGGKTCKLLLYLQLGPYEIIFHVVCPYNFIPK